MAMVDVGGLWLKSVGLVQRSATVWRCSAFIACTGRTYAMTQDESRCLHHNLIVVLWYYYYYYYYSRTIFMLNK